MFGSFDLSPPPFADQRDYTCFGGGSRPEATVSAEQEQLQLLRRIEAKLDRLLRAEGYGG